MEQKRHLNLVAVILITQIWSGVQTDTTITPEPPDEKTTTTTFKPTSKISHPTALMTVTTTEYEPVDHENPIQPLSGKLTIVSSYQVK